MSRNNLWRLNTDPGGGSLHREEAGRQSSILRPGVEGFEKAGGKPSVVEIRDLSVSFDAPGRTVRPISGLSLSVAPSEFLCIVGPNGSGKTTLLNVVAGFVRPAAGEVLIGGKVVRGRGMDRGIVFQEYALFPWRTALKNVEFGLESIGVKADERRETAMGYLALVGLEEFAGIYPHQLSGGMKQRVAIARALAHNPSILLMDEPFAALDAITREKLQLLVERIWAETGKTVLYVTHSLSEAICLADRVVVLTSQGKTFERPVDLPRPRSRHSAAFVDIRKELHRALRLPGPGKRAEGNA
jgi:NitT/TauT family transport system ATP-binding protein